MRRVRDWPVGEREIMWMSPRWPRWEVRCLTMASQAGFSRS